MNRDNEIEIKFQLLFKRISVLLMQKELLKM